jgi:cytochrome c oxidase assembly factor CtaG
VALSASLAISIGVTSALSAVVQLGPLAVLAELYRRRARTLAGGGQPVPGWRQACFYGGLTTIGVALAGLGAGSQELLAVHMVEHLLIGDIGAILLVLGLTGPLLAPVLRISIFNRLRALSNPAIALPLWVADLYIWHIPVLYQAALRHDGVHALEHVMFLTFGVNLWMALLGPLPAPAWFKGGQKALYVFGYWFAGMLLANAFIWIATVFYPFYKDTDRALSIAPLTDQTLAGAAMMIECSLVTLTVGSWLLMQTLREAEERQHLVELARARGVELSEDRAARAVRAGRGAELRRRLEERGGIAADV